MLLGIYSCLSSLNMPRQFPSFLKTEEVKVISGASRSISKAFGLSGAGHLAPAV